MSDEEGQPPAGSTTSTVRNWISELIIVAVGVLLALWAQAWFEDRKESELHREVIAQLDELLGRTLVQTAARVASSHCAVARIAAIDRALSSSDGQWQAMPLPDLPGAMATGHYKPVYVMDTDVLPLQIFETARQSGALATLDADQRRFYEAMERELNWLNEVWAASSTARMQLSILGVDGPLGDSARDAMRMALAGLDYENRVTVLRARALAQLARERGFALTPSNLEAFRGKIERDRRLFGACVEAQLDPLQLTSPPAAGPGDSSPNTGA